MTCISYFLADSKYQQVLNYGENEVRTTGLDLPYRAARLSSWGDIVQAERTLENKASGQNLPVVHSCGSVEEADLLRELGRESPFVRAPACSEKCGRP